MPNGGLHDDEGRHYDALELRELQRILRDLCAHVERNGWSLTTGADEWWKKKKRSEEEAAERQRARLEREAVAEAARRKLTPEERAALGMKSPRVKAASILHSKG